MYDHNYFFSLNGKFSSILSLKLKFFFHNNNKKKKTFKTLQVLKGNIGHFRSKMYFYYFEAIRGTFISLEVYGYFGYFLTLMAYFSHFGWSDCVNEVNQSFSVGGYNNTYPSCNQMEIQNLTVGLVECGEIFVFVNYNDNQTIKL